VARCPKCEEPIDYLIVTYKDKGITDIIAVGSGLPMGRLVLEKEFRCPLCNEVLTDDYEEAFRLLGAGVGNIA